MNISESMIDEILKEMGVEPNKPARWKPHYYTSMSVPPAKRQEGWFCSKCGKHSWVKRNVCDGCDSHMQEEGGSCR